VLAVGELVGDDRGDLGGRSSSNVSWTTTRSVGPMPTTAALTRVVRRLASPR
jgi:hypothetical protein